VIESGLTARERAILVLRAWRQREEPDERLRKYMPAEQREEFDRIVEAVEQANDHAYQAVAFWYEWLAQLDIEVGLAEAVVTLLDRVEDLERHPLTEPGRKRPRRRRSGLRPPRRGFVRDMPLAWGQKAGEDKPVPSTWPEARERLLDDCRGNVSIRWQELAAMEIALSELADALREEMTHIDLREGLDRCRAKVLELHAALVELGQRFVLPDPEERHLAIAREYVSVDSLSEERGKEAPGREPRASLAESQLEELERVEGEWKATTRRADRVAR
jgi:hypothetical protein